jgi:hypothetical protein
MAQIIKFLAVIALVVSIIWLISAPGFEAALSLITSMSALAATFVIEKRSKRQVQQNQSVSKSSMGIQAGGDVHMGNINNKNAK